MNDKNCCLPLLLHVQRADKNPLSVIHTFIVFLFTLYIEKLTSEANLTSRQVNTPWRTPPGSAA